MTPEQRSHPHLELGREQPVTGRRPPSGFPRVKPPDDPEAHGGLLEDRLRIAREAASEDLGGYDDRRLIKISLNQKISPEDVARASGHIQIVSQEDGELVLAFATEAQLEEFEARLSSLATGGNVTHRRLLYALQDFDRWTPEDRTGFALKHHGLPATDSFAIDAELWPLALTRDAARLREAFEGWVGPRSGRSRFREAASPHGLPHSMRPGHGGITSSSSGCSDRRSTAAPWPGALSRLSGRSGVGCGTRASHQRSWHCGARHRACHGSPAPCPCSRRFTELFGWRLGRRRTRTWHVRVGNRALRRHRRVPATPKVRAGG